MRNGRWFAGVLLMTVLLLCGCGLETSNSDAHRTEDGRIIVRVSMFNNSSYPLWRAYVENQCPGIAIRWENNRNHMANVLYQARHDDIPDIVAIRRFETDTARELQPYLSDLRTLEQTKSFAPRCLEPFAAEDGMQCWLPEPGVVDGIVAQRRLFERYGIPLPKDRKSFLQACAQFSAQGIEPLAVDGKAAWTPIQLLEGFAYPEFSRTETGRAWWDSFLRGSQTSLDPVLFRQLTAILRELQQHQILTDADLQLDGTAVDQLLRSKRAALGRKASDEIFDAAGMQDYRMLPFFGTEPEDSWLYTYPVFVLAMSRNMTENDELQKAGEQVLSVMLSEEAQQILNTNGMGLISYNPAIHLQHSPALEEVEPLIQKEHYFIRKLNSNSFMAASQALTALLRDGADDAAFFFILEQNLSREPARAEIGISNIAASSMLDAQLCSAAGSAAAQILCAQTGSDCAVIDASEVQASIYRGSYTDRDIQTVAAGSDIYTCTMSGADLRQMLDDCIFYSTTFVPGNIEPLLEYPVLGGLKVTMQRDGTIENIVLTSGSPLQSEKVYRVSVSSSIYRALRLRRHEGTGQFQATGKSLRQYFMEYFRLQGKLPEPQLYYSTEDTK